MVDDDAQLIAFVPCAVAVDQAVNVTPAPGKGPSSGQQPDVTPQMMRTYYGR